MTGTTGFPVGSGVSGLKIPAELTVYRAAACRAESSAAAAPCWRNTRSTAKSSWKCVPGWDGPDGFRRICGGVCTRRAPSGPPVSLPDARAGPACRRNRSGHRGRSAHHPRRGRRGSHRCSPRRFSIRSLPRRQYCRWRFERIHRNPVRSGSSGRNRIPALPTADTSLPPPPFRPLPPC